MADEQPDGTPSTALTARAASGWATFQGNRGEDGADRRSGPVGGPEGMNGLPVWLHEGALVLDTAAKAKGIIQFIGEWADPTTRRVFPQAVFLRPEGGGQEWIVPDHQALSPPTVA
ncbi:hypothetical protein AB0F20_09755 [Streptomyces goshikiensis]|uniref:hypothetical protein n=1 Tax=Streptomyces goshikiensis TaxID=1942 RepID=UPI0033F4751B